MSRQTQIYLLLALFAVLCLVGYYEYGPSSGPSLTGVTAADTAFQPLDVQEPGLRTDELDKIRKLEYAGSHRNIFLATPPPPTPTATAAAAEAKIVGDPFPKVPPPPPPVQVPAEFFGYATQKSSGRRVAFFSAGDDVLVVAEGDKFLGNFRLVHIGNESADVEQISDGRHATVQLTQPPDQNAGAGGGNQ
jgi:hypothetical protein